ncbi:MAG: FG-GAP repeat protein [Planctomycetes bacterium]|nr:FG-GAP repeat protein [Planctomycetota bacterium]
MNQQHSPKTGRLFSTFLFAGATLFALGTAPIHADPPEQNEIAKLLPVPGIELGRFGKSVSIDGDTLVVGAPNYVPEPTGPGLVYIYNRDAQGNWVEHANLVVCDAACGDGFGRAVSIDGDTIIVGAPAAANSEIDGAAYIFTRNEQGDWSQQAKLMVSDPRITNLGGSVALEGNTAVVGLISSNIPEVFIFVRDQNGHWSHESTLSAPGTNATDVLAIQGDTIIVGAPFFGLDDPEQTTFGAVYVFTRDENGNWAQQAQLLDPNPVKSFNFFGGSVAFDSNTLVIGSLTFSVSRAYIFDRNEQGDWLMQQVLDPDGNSSPDNFGASVAIQGDTLVVGASHDAPSGSAHIFTRDARGIWSEHAKLLQSDAGNNDNFGAAVAFDNDTIIVGARGDDDNGSSSGSAYVFDAAGTPGKCPWDLDNNAEVGVSDLLVLLAAWGPVPTPDPPDFDGDGFVSVSDLLILFANWGPCAK